MININNLNFYYKDKIIIKTLNLNIKPNEFVTIAGPCASGKTTLVKLLSGLLKSDNKITIDNNILNEENLNAIRKTTGVVLNTFFTFDTIIEEMKSVLENLNVFDFSYIDFLVKEFNIKSLIEKKFNNLNLGEKQIVSLVMALVHKPKLLLIDEGLSNIKNKDKVIKKLKKLNITVLNFTKDLSESFYSDRLIILNKEILLNGSVKKVLEKDKILNKIGLEIPFIIDLSMNLKLYGIIDKMYFNEKEMVENIWK